MSKPIPPAALWPHRSSGTADRRAAPARLFDSGRVLPFPADRPSSTATADPLAPRQHRAASAMPRSHLVWPPVPHRPAEGGHDDLDMDEPEADGFLQQDAAFDLALPLEDIASRISLPPSLADRLDRLSAELSLQLAREAAIHGFAGTMADDGDAAGDMHLVLDLTEPAEAPLSPSLSIHGIEEVEDAEPAVEMWDAPASAEDGFDEPLELDADDMVLTEVASVATLHSADHPVELEPVDMAAYPAEAYDDRAIDPAPVFERRQSFEAYDFEPRRTEPQVAAPLPRHGGNAADPARIRPGFAQYGDPDTAEITAIDSIVHGFEARQRQANLYVILGLGSASVITFAILWAVLKFAA